MAMGSFLDALKAGIKGYKGAHHDPREYLAAGRPIRCPHCGEGRFVHGSALLNSRGRRAFDLDWGDPAATVLVCAECGRIEWYAHAPDELSH